MKSETELEMEEMARRGRDRQMKDNIREAVWLHVKQYHLASIEHRCAYCGGDTGHYTSQYCSPYCKKHGDEK